MSPGVQESDESKIRHGSGRQGRHCPGERFPDQFPSCSRGVHFQFEFDIALVVQIDAQDARDDKQEHAYLKNAQDSGIVAKKPDYERREAQSDHSQRHELPRFLVVAQQDQFAAGAQGAQQEYGQ